MKPGNKTMQSDSAGRKQLSTYNSKLVHLYLEISKVMDICRKTKIERNNHQCNCKKRSIKLYSSNGRKIPGKNLKIQE